MRLSRVRANGLGASAASAPWFANQSFKSYHSIRISIAIHSASASEILTNQRRARPRLRAPLLSWRGPPLFGGWAPLLPPSPPSLMLV